MRNSVVNEGTLGPAVGPKCWIWCRLCGLTANSSGNRGDTRYKAQLREDMAYSRMCKKVHQREARLLHGTTLAELGGLP